MREREFDSPSCLGYEEEPCKLFAWHCSLCGATRHNKIRAEEHIKQEHPGTDAYPFEQEV